jgi:hypothetical protein
MTSLSCTNCALLGPMCPYHGDPVLAPHTQDELDDILLAYQKYALPRPNPRPVHFTPRQRLRIWRNNQRRRAEQWIHDHLHNAHCDG